MYFLCVCVCEKYAFQEGGKPCGKITTLKTAATLSDFFFSHEYSFNSGHKELIQSLTWDGTGSRLLSTDLVGICKLWTMKVTEVFDDVLFGHRYMNF